MTSGTARMPGDRDALSGAGGEDRLVAGLVGIGVAGWVVTPGDPTPPPVPAACRSAAQSAVNAEHQWLLRDQAWTDGKAPQNIPAQPAATDLQACGVTATNH